MSEPADIRDAWWRRCEQSRETGDVEGAVRALYLSMGEGQSPAEPSAIATGRPWMDHFVVDDEAVNRRCLVILAEDSEQDRDRRLFNIAEAYGLNARERRMLTDRVDIVGMTGHDVTLGTANRHTGAVTATPLLEELRAFLEQEAGEDGWAVIIIDPLARFAPPEAESDNGIATKFVQQLELLKSVPGGPTVIVLHHSSLDGAKTGAVRGRGVTGLRNGVRFEAYLRHDRDGGILFKLDKSNVSMRMQHELPVCWDRGVLRVVERTEIEEREGEERERKAADAAERAERRAEVKAAELARKSELELEKVLSAIRAAGPDGLPNRDVVRRRAAVTDSACREALGEAELQGLIVVTGSTRDRKIVAAEHADQEAP